MKIFYVHHAQRNMGNSPSQNDKITKLGIKEAKVVGKLFLKLQKKMNIQAIYTSPYYRCLETAKIISKIIKVPVFLDERFNEFNNVHNAVNGKGFDEKGETWIDCQLRIRKALHDIVDKYNEKDTVICVTSGVNISAFISLAYHVQISEKMPFPIVPACSPVGFDIDNSCFENGKNKR